MDALKNIFQITLMILFLLKRGVESSGKITQFDLNDTPEEDENTGLFDLNDLSEEARNESMQLHNLDDTFEDEKVDEQTRLHNLINVLVEGKEERKRCTRIIYEELQISKTLSSRLAILRKILPSTNIHTLVSKYAKEYVNYLADIVVPVTITIRQKEPQSMMNPHTFCATKFLEKVHINLANYSCIERLRQMYTIKDNTTEVLKDAFKNLVIIGAVYNKGDYAYEYYQHIFKFMGCSIDDNLLKTPNEYCKETIPLPKLPLLKKRAFPSTQKSQPKSRKSDPTNDRSNLPSSSNQQA